MLDVCICTHSPQKQTLALVLAALAQQTLGPQFFQILVIDNANKEPLTPSNPLFEGLVANKIPFKIYREEKLGIAAARTRALRESKAEAIVFVDDDNVLDENFLRNASEILANEPQVGCFSGKILLHRAVKVPSWTKPLLGSLAIRDVGEKPIVKEFTGDWAPWVPAATASMVLRRAVSDVFLKNHASREEFFEFGRRGKKNLMSGEDFLICLSAVDAGLKCGYFPQLVMHHLIREDRFELSQLAKLMYSLALTDLKREVYLDYPLRPFAKSEFVYRLLALHLKEHAKRARFCYWLYEFTYLAGRSYRLLKAGKPIFVGDHHG